MNKNDVKSVLELISNREKVLSILPKIHEDAPSLYEFFGHDVIDLYNSVSKEYKDKIVEVILNELNLL